MCPRKRYQCNKHVINSVYQNTTTLNAFPFFLPLLTVIKISNVILICPPSPRWKRQLRFSACPIIPLKWFTYRGRLPSIQQLIRVAAFENPSLGLRSHNLVQASMSSGTIVLSSKIIVFLSTTSRARRAGQHPCRSMHFCHTLVHIRVFPVPHM